MREPTTPTPSVGRIVHYVAYGTPGGEFPEGAHRAAIITEVYARPDRELTGRAITDTIDPQVAGLCVLNPTGMYFTRQVRHDPTGTQPGTWHWPEYVPSP